MHAVAPSISDRPSTRRWSSPAVTRFKRRLTTPVVIRRTPSFGPMLRLPRRHSINILQRRHSMRVVNASSRTYLLVGRRRRKHTIAPGVVRSDGVIVRSEAESVGSVGDSGLVFGSAAVDGGR